MREWICGRNPVYECLRARRRDLYRLHLAEGVEERGRLQEIMQLARERKLPIQRVARHTLDKLDDAHQGVGLECSEYPYSGLEDIIQKARGSGESAFVLALDMIQNPQNLGTLLRSAEAAGLHGVLIPLARAAGVTPAVVHASSGACEHLLIAQVNLANALTELKERADAWVVGLEGSPEAQPYTKLNLKGALVIVVGNEGEGMRPLVRSRCDLLASLPMRGEIDSLNAAVAGSILIYRALESRLAG